MKILVVYYSMYGHLLHMARAVAEGAQAVAGAEVILRRVEEFESIKEKIQASMHGRLVEEQQKEIPFCHPGRSGGRGRHHLRHPHPVRQHDRPDEGPLRFHRGPVG